MKNIILLILSSILFIGCQKSFQDKVNELVETQSKKLMYYPDSYDPVNTETFSYDVVLTNENIKLANKAFKLGEEVNKLNKDIYKYTTKLYFIKTQKEIDDLKNKRDRLNNEINNIILYFIEQEKENYSEETLNKGYTIAHEFRAKDNDGKVSFVQIVFLVDKDVKNVINWYNADDTNFKNFNKMYYLIRNKLGNNEPNGYESLKLVLE